MNRAPRSIFHPDRVRGATASSGNDPDDVATNDDIGRALEERFLDEMRDGYLDGRREDTPEPSSNRSSSYRHGFANGRDDLTHSPRLPAQALRLLADRAIREDVATARGLDV